MNDKQIAIVQKQLHDENSIDVDQSLDKKLKFFNLSADEQKVYRKKILDKFNNGISALNKKQLSNLIERFNQDNYDQDAVRNKLKFYEIDEVFYSEIFQFFSDYSSSNTAINVSQIDKDFKGVQVASRDDFNTIINQGYTGDWVLNPDSIKHNFVQVASMNETGNFPRGNYINAEITKLESIDHGDQTRYRIFIKNPIVIDSGNRNVKFNLNPVTYID